MLFPRFAQTAAALLLSAIGFAAPVQAQNNKQIISGTWYEDRASNGGNQSDILLTFAQTPANQFLNVTNVACNFTAASGQVISTMNLFAGTTSGANDLGRTYSIKGSATSETLGSSQILFHCSEWNFLQVWTRPVPHHPDLLTIDRTVFQRCRLRHRRKSDRKLSG
jgi:hypothetical protein